MHDNVLVHDAKDIPIYEHMWGPRTIMLELSASPAHRSYGPSSPHFFLSVRGIAMSLVIICFASAVSFLWIFHHLKANDPIEFVCSLSLSFINAFYVKKMPPSVTNSFSPKLVSGNHSLESYSLDLQPTFIIVLTCIFNSILIFIIFLLIASSYSS